MAELWFYHLERSELERALPPLLEKCLQRGWRALVVVLVLLASPSLAARDIRVARGVDVPVSRREFAILHALMERPGTVLSRVQLEDRLYGWDMEVESNAVEVHIHKLRAKLGRTIIETLRGVGYRLGTPAR